MKLFYRSLAMALAALAYLVLAPINFLSDAAVKLAPDLFGPLDATLTLALDRISAYIKAEASASKSAYRAFIERSLTHDNFTAGQFDTGRMSV